MVIETTLGGTLASTYFPPFPLGLPAISHIFPPFPKYSRHIYFPQTYSLTSSRLSTTDDLDLDLDLTQPAAAANIERMWW